MAWCLWSSLVALLITKAADVVSTWRRVGEDRETNPIAGPLFRRLGLARGMTVICVLYVLLVSVQYSLVWISGYPVLIWANSALGFLIAWVQLDVARFNTTGRHSAVTSLACRAHARWAHLQTRLLSWWRNRRSNS